MSAAGAAADGGAGGGGGGGEGDRPLGADGKPIPSVADIQKVRAAKKFEQQQQQVDEVIGMMHKNVEQVLDRDAKLSALEERADALQDGSAQFEKRAGSLKNKFWMENLKSMIMMGVVGLILLGLVYFMFFKPDPQPMYAPPPPPPPQQLPPPAEGGGGESGGGGEGE